MTRHLEDWTSADQNRRAIVTSNTCKNREMSDRIAVMARATWARGAAPPGSCVIGWGAGENGRIELRRPKNDAGKGSSPSRRTIERQDEKAPHPHFLHTAESGSLEAIMRLVLEADLGVQRVSAIEIQLQDVIDQLEHGRA